LGSGSPGAKAPAREEFRSSLLAPIRHSTEIVTALYFPGELTETAEKVLMRDPAWASPMIWRTLLPHYLEAPLRSGILTRELINSILEEAAKLFLSREFPSPVKDNMEFLYNSVCSAFITPFLDLAAGLNIPLITTDAEAARAFPETVVSAAEFSTGSKNC
jgi:hypothetical protein